MESVGMPITAAGLVETFRADKLNIYVYNSRPAMGTAAATAVAAEISGLIKGRGKAVGIFASAPSQNEFLAALVEAPGINCVRDVAFHLDEDLGMDNHSPPYF